MPVSDETTPGGTGVPAVPDAKAFSRREFLRIAGLSGAAIGITGGLGGIFAACGEEEDNHDHRAATQQDRRPVTSSTAALPPPPRSAGAEAGREIKVGFVTPITGPIALFGVPDQYCVSRWTEGGLRRLGMRRRQEPPVKIIVRTASPTPTGRRRWRAT